MMLRYAISAVSYVLDNLSNQVFNNVKQVIIFGSVARGTASEDSDIDIFFDTNKSYKKEIIRWFDAFYTSNQGLLFKAKGISNKFQILADRLEKWKDLHKSIASEGITVYGPYHGKSPKGLKHHFIISWENLDIKNRGAFLNKLYGYSAGKTKYHGMVKKWRAVKIGKSAILLPAEYKQDAFDVLNSYAVDFKIIDVYL